MKKIVDGNLACSKVAYLFSEVASIYPITPSSPMASNVDDLVSSKLVNIFGSKPKVLEMQSEAGAAGAMHGALLTGSLASTFTASQGLLLMLPNMYKMAGEMLPGVIHVAARSLASHALSIFGDHQDVYAVRSSGFNMLASSSVFDAQNLAAVAHLSAIEGSLPFLHFFDGFRTSHELNTIEEINEEELKKLVNKEKLNEYKNRILNLNSNKQFGMAENEDIYFQNLEVRNQDYDKIPDIVNDYMEKINNIMKTDYKPFNYYGSSTAENIIVAMGSVSDTVKELLVNLKDESIAFIEVHLYRPFSKKYLENIIPSTVKNIAVLDRTKEFGSSGEPLYLDVVSTLQNKNLNIVGGRYGLSSKNVTPSDIYDVFHMLKTNLKNNFTIGIDDDVTHLSLEKQDFTLEEDTYNVKIYGFGSDGMVSASKNILKLLNQKENYFVQGYFEYDSKKSGGVTVSNLRISGKEINKPYYTTTSKIMVVTKYEYFSRLDMVHELEDNGILVINTNKNNEEINSSLTDDVKSILKTKNIITYFIDAEKIALDNHIKGKISKIMEFIIFKLMGKDYKEDIIESLRKTFKSKGEEIINNNINSINDALNKINKLELTNSVSTSKKEEITIYEKINNRKGNTLKVSEFLNGKDGSFPCALSQTEKRKISTLVPIWKKENCIQCNQCSFVCPHSVIRPFLDNNTDGIPALGSEYNYSIKVSKDDCTGCTLCVKTCPGKAGEKALVMDNYDNAPIIDDTFNTHINPSIMDKFNIKGSQFCKPKFEFSGACAGCGETPYIKLLTQLFGDNIIIANATGCSSIYGGSAPSTPYSLPWANSLFEDNAEFALGMHISNKQKRNQIKTIVEKSISSVDSEVKSIFEKFVNNFEDKEITNQVKKELENKDIPNEIKELINYIPSRTVWAVGGDGWAYDIGYGGLDHVLHTNENIKVLVLDTEVYSNTGGQASKATKKGAVAQFANMGKDTIKKDLFKIASCAPNCYVASISLGASPMQTVKAFKEAETHNGPAIIIAYSPCIEHGIKSGMLNSLDEQKLAVDSGYTLLMRYNPTEEKLYLDSKEPNFEKYLDFLKNESRFNALFIKNEELATKLFEEQKEAAIKRYNSYKKQNEEK